MEKMYGILLLTSAILGLFYILYMLGRKEINNERKVYGSATYARLCSFQYFVRNCSITFDNFNNIKSELDAINKLDEMTDLVFRIKVNEIMQDFENRFNEWICA